MLPHHISAYIDDEIAASATDFGDLRVVVLNGTLIEPADIGVLATPDLARRLVLDDQARHRTALRILRRAQRQGQGSYYGKVGVVLVTGNEDGGKYCAAQMLYSLAHIGFTIPPQSDALMGR